MRSRALPIVLGLIGLTLLAVFCVQRHARQIQEDIQTRASAALLAAGFDAAEARVSGRTVTLIGSAADAAACRRAGEAVAAVDGVGHVENLILIVRPAPAVVTTPPESSEPYVLRFNYRADILTLEGAIPSEADRQAIMNIARARFGENQVIDRLRVRPDAPLRFTTALQETVIKALPSFVEASGKIADTTIQIDGKVRDKADAERIEALTSMAVPRDFTLEFKAEAVSDAPAQGYVTTADEAAIASCQQRFNDLLRVQGIQFDKGKAEIKPESHALLDKLAELVKSCEDMRIEIAGHTDNRGDAARNRTLSEARANAVRAYLIAKGVPGARLVARGYGAEKPVADNRTPAGQARNRRIEFNIERG